MTEWLNENHASSEGQQRLQQQQQQQQQRRNKPTNQTSKKGIEKACFSLARCIGDG